MTRHYVALAVMVVVGCGKVASQNPDAKACSPDTRSCEGSHLLTCSAGVETDEDCGALGCDSTTMTCRCDMGRNRCGGSCVDLMADAANCGACGHGCLGGTCSAGKCQPVELANGQSSATGIAVDAANVYWVIQVASTGSVRAVPKAGGTFVTLAPNQDQPRTVVSDGTTVYFGGAMTHVRTVPVGGGNTLNFAMRNPDSPVNQIYVDATYVWWVEHNILTGGTSSARRMTKAVGGVIEPLATSPDGASDLTAVGDCVYFIAPFNTPKLIRDCPGISGAVHTAPAGGNIAGVKSDNSYVYFLEANVKRLPIAGGPVEPLAVTSATGRDLAIDANNIYFIEGTSATMACGTNWSIKKTPKAGGAVTTLVGPPQGCPSRLAVDDVAVYWTNQVSGQIMKVAK